MKILFSLILLSLCSGAFAQDLETLLKKVRTVEQANDFVESNDKFEAEVISMSSDKDSSELFNRLFREKAGAIAVIDGYAYKILDKRNSYMVRAADIYFDGNRMSKPKIDSLRTVILTKYNSGVPFEALIKDYNMDAEGGDLGWITEGTTAREFETTVRDHNKGEIFTVDVPISNWYYVAIKTADTRDIRLLSVLKLKNQPGLSTGL